ncbi:hypothetical protein [Pseudomonas sp. NPDC096950]|uniref:phage tail fiber protein n=1 Tax=Pseudomonas sp. NPDC096950 TaxID=3364485 RepID=UPI00383A7CDA
MPWYKAGTVSVTQNSNAVIGAGTAFIANSRVGDGFRGPDGWWYEVINIASDTAMSISPNYQGATNGAGSYAMAPLQGYVKDSADALRALVNTYGAKLAVLGTTGNYEILPVSKGGTGAGDAPGARTALGTAKSGANADITELNALTKALTVAQGGTGGTSQTTARSGLGLGTAAVANVGTAAGNVMPVGAGGWLGSSTIDSTNMNNAKATGLYGVSNAVNAPYAAIQLLTSDWGVDPRWQSQLALGISQNKAYIRSILKDQTSATSWAELYHTGNTTRGSGGALSAASPIVRIANVADTQRRDLQEQTFEPAGVWGVANEEAHGVLVERLDVGEYRVSGSLGLALEGWRTQDPCSPDGGRILGITESQQAEDGTVTIKLFKQRWTLSDDGEMIPGRGAPIDVPLNSWIDVRLAMPEPVMPIPTIEE